MREKQVIEISENEPLARGGRGYCTTSPLDEQFRQVFHANTH